MNSLQTDMLEILVKNTTGLIQSGYYDTSIDVMDNPYLGFPRFLSLLKQRFTIIGEIKPASPTTGQLFSRDDLEDKIDTIALGVDGISVLTEPNYFGGSLGSLQKVAKYQKPTLMKDFIIDEKQIGAAPCSAILLIERILDKIRREELISFAHQRKLEVILEVDNESDFVNCLDTSADILAVNNRNLSTMKIDNTKASQLVDQYNPKRPVLGFSGYRSYDQIIQARNSGLAGVLIGSQLSSSSNPTKFMTTLRRQLLQ